MGIGNGGHRFFGHGYHLELITPHGDRERGSRPPARVRAVTHYPSWGSGTSGGTGQSDGNVAHYPSWGSGTGFGFGCHQFVHLISLPLMGIGNLKNTDYEEDATTAHYPSWGSGTRICLAYGETNFQLITPHGDREPAAWAPGMTPLTGPHYPSWGSGTAVPGVRRPFLQELITPHGDRERSWPRTTHELRFDSLPLMGIGNPVSASSA